MDHDTKEQLDRIEANLAKLVRAVFGEAEIHDGLIHDMQEMKKFREGQMLKSAGVAGAVTVVMLFTKNLITKLFQ